jgi:hypothetical protein
VIAWLYVIVFQRPMLQRWLSATDAADPSIHGWAVFQHQIPLAVFLVAATVLTFFCFTRRLSLIPVIGVLTCGYLMTELGITNWIRFGVWLAIGLVFYFAYGVRHSKLAQASAA